MNVTGVAVSSILLNPTTGAAIVPTTPSTAAQVPATASASAPPSDVSVSAAPVAHSGGGGSNVGGIIGGVAGGIIVLGLLGEWERATCRDAWPVYLCLSHAVLSNGVPSRVTQKAECE